jgi:hypothetical protein
MADARKLRNARQRRWRFRQKLSRKVVSLEYDNADLDMLIDRGHLLPNEAEDLAAVSRAVAEYMIAGRL